MGYFQIVENNPSIVSIKFFVRTYRTLFYLEKVLTLKSNEPKLYIFEKLKNERYMDIELMWVHHPTFGSNLLDDSTIINVPKNKIKYVLKPENEGKYDEISNGDYNWPVFKGYNNKDTDFSKAPTSEEEDKFVDEVCLENLDEG